MTVISTLIDKQDNFEVVRDEIAAILFFEIKNQMAKAIVAKKPPEEWKLRIFTERSNPWEQFLDITPETDLSPLVNIWYDNGNFPEGKGNVVERQVHEATYNLDCYAYGVSADDPGGGHKPGDKEAALEVQRTVRLVRNILMAAVNTYLQLQGTVWQRWVQSITIFQPELEGVPAQQIHGARIALRVTFNEFSPQVTPEILELVSVDVKRVEDGQIVLKADYDYTP
ncbi:MAG: hypothetical protein KAR06_04585 [Deltaproteobacteria bacterium]|nr:hypothetical protein [Deltaproteobacteria bacterium]